MKRILSLILSVVMAMGLMAPCAVAAAPAQDPFKVVVSIEGETLGQGIYHGPKAYTLDEINTLVATKGYGPYTEDTLTASMATLAFFVDNNIESDMTGDWENNFYMSGVKGLDTGVVNIPAVITANGGPSTEDAAAVGNDDEWLGQFDYSSAAGWMITCNDFMINVGASGWKLKSDAAANSLPDYGNTYTIRWQFTVHGFGADLGLEGWGGPAMYPRANKDPLYIAYANSTSEAAKAAALPVMEKLDATQTEVDAAYEALLAAETPAAPVLDPKQVLKDTLAQLDVTVPEPTFGTTAGEWTLISQARSGAKPLDDPYFTGYYDRIVEMVKAKAPADGRLHRIKSTENSRLIMALSALGKNARDVGGYDLAAPLEDINWIQKQGINGPMWALLALDSQNYETTDPTYRKQLITLILQAQLPDGGWALSGETADADMTAMALQALAKYKDTDMEVRQAGKKAMYCLSTIQDANGGFSSWGTVNSESISQVIIALSAWSAGFDTANPFVKNGNSPVDALLSFYIPEEKGFRHVMEYGVNGMATDQAALALTAYCRAKEGKTALYDMTDIPLEPVAPKVLSAELGLPAEIKNAAGTTFNATVNANMWDNEAGYKLIDFIMPIPEGLTVTGVAAGDRLSGGEVSYHVDADNNLRVVYFDANTNASLTVSGSEFPAELFNISFALEDAIAVKPLELAITGMTVKLSSDSSSEASMIVVNTDKASGTVNVVSGISYSAVCLYQGDGVDLIPADKKAVAVAVTGVKSNKTLSYNDGANTVSFLYNEAITAKTGVSTYVALVDASIPMENFSSKANFTLPGGAADTLTFGDVNADGIINAQDALGSVDAWLRKTPVSSDVQILVLNVNGDSRINTFDALGIVESFVNQSEFAVVTKAATLKK